MVCRQQAHQKANTLDQNQNQPLRRSRRVQEQRFRKKNEQEAKQNAAQKRTNPVAPLQSERRQKCLVPPGTKAPPQPNYSPGPLEHWAAHKEWPASFFKKGMDRFKTARERPSYLKQALVSQHTENESSKVPSTYTANPRVYMRRDCRKMLERGGAGTRYFMDEYEACGQDSLTHNGPNQTSQTLCYTLQSKKREVSNESPLSDDAGFVFRLKRLSLLNESGVISLLGHLVCPSAAELACKHIHNGALGYQYSLFVDHWNERWVNQPSLIDGFPAPQPDYCVGFSQKAFSTSQLAIIDKATGSKASINPTAWMYFPFLTCEAKSSKQSIEFANNQNAYSMMVSILALVDLFKGARREEKLHREILGFSISYNNMNVLLHGHYPVLDREGQVDIFQTEILSLHFSLNRNKNGNRWDSWNIVQNIYEQWAPTHLQRICEVLENFDPGFSVSELTSAASESADQFPGLQTQENVQDQEPAESDSTVRPNRRHGAYNYGSQTPAAQLSPPTRHVPTKNHNTRKRRRRV